ncbi:MAG: SpoIIE family protein phosphatase [Phycisphaerales bacterium]|jgi:sigma-B regulation protein RsbU (phosphoserine phosphatase)|nr:SpoIIE family protein phosphatase [Phycisphaerales bacterium]
MSDAASAHPAPASSIVLTRVAGPESGPTRIELAAPGVIGRAENCDVRLDAPDISRRHAELLPRERDWSITDLSRHGTFVNGVRLRENEPRDLGLGDRVRIGPWTFVVGDSATARTAGREIQALFEDAGTISSLSIQHLKSSKQRLSGERLRLVTELGAKLFEASDEVALADLLLRTSMAGTSFAWGAVVADAGAEDAFDVLSEQNRPGEASVSRSLIHAAKDGPVTLEQEASIAGSASIVSSRTAAAIAAPVRVGDEASWYVYLASSRRSVELDDEVAIFIEALTHMAGFALADRRRRELEARQAEIQRELSAARRVQERFLPRAGATVAGLRVGLTAIPGKGMAGDFAGVRELRGGEVAIFLGDVAGKGSAAAMLMAAAQSFLEASLDQHEPLERTASALNRYIAARVGIGEFLTLWLARIDPASGRGVYIDAGHGYAFMLHSGGDVKPLTEGGGVVVGIDADAQYEPAAFDLSSGDRIMVCSDGLPEQSAPSGDRFGVSGLREAIARDPRAELPPLLHQAVCAFAGREQLDDDLTIMVVSRES